MEHTPRPWIKNRNIIETASGEEIARVSYERDGYVQANARLIAAAPALLEALEGLTDTARRIPGAYTGALAEPLHLARAAIEAATIVPEPCKYCGGEGAHISQATWNSPVLKQECERCLGTGVKS